MSHNQLSRAWRVCYAIVGALFVVAGAFGTIGELGWAIVHGYLTAWPAAFVSTIITVLGGYVLYASWRGRTLFARSDAILHRFHDRRRGPDLPFVLDDEVEVIEGIYAGKRGTVDLLDYGRSPKQYLVDFGDGTDELFLASALKLLDSAAEGASR